MRTKVWRRIFRWSHIVLGLVVMAYIYSPFHEERAFQVIVKFFVVPVLTLSGIGIWQFSAWTRFLQKNRPLGEEGAESGQNSQTKGES